MSDNISIMTFNAGCSGTMHRNISACIKIPYKGKVISVAVNADNENWSEIQIHNSISPDDKDIIFRTAGCTGEELHRVMELLDKLLSRNNGATEIVHYPSDIYWSDVSHKWEFKIKIERKRFYDLSGQDMVSTETTYFDSINFPTYYWQGNSPATAKKDMRMLLDHMQGSRHWHDYYNKMSSIVLDKV